MRTLNGVARELLRAHTWYWRTVAATWILCGTAIRGLPSATATDESLLAQSVRSPYTMNDRMISVIPFSIQIIQSLPPQDMAYLRFMKVQGLVTLMRPTNMRYGNLFGLPLC